VVLLLKSSRNLTNRLAKGAQYLKILHLCPESHQKELINNELGLINSRTLRHYAQQATQFASILVKRPLTRDEVLPKTKLLSLLVNRSKVVTRLLKRRQIHTGCQLRSARRSLACQSKPDPQQKQTRKPKKSSVSDVEKIKSKLEKLLEAYPKLPQKDQPGCLQSLKSLLAALQPAKKEKLSDAKPSPESLPYSKATQNAA
jgi:hypothetical protein